MVNEGKNPHLLNLPGDLRANCLGVGTEGVESWVCAGRLQITDLSCILETKTLRHCLFESTVCSHARGEVDLQVDAYPR